MFSYQMIRLIFIVCVVVLFLLINYKFKFIVNVQDPIKKKNKPCVKRKSATIIAVALAVVIIAVSFYPFEKYFIKFSSVEDSFSYSIFQGNQYKIYEHSVEDCVFVYCDKSGVGNYCSVMQNEDKTYKMIDTNSEKHTYGYSSTDDNDYYLVECNAVYNNVINKTCYYIRNCIPESKKDIDRIFWNKDELQNICYEENAYGEYFIVKEGYFEDTINLTVNDTDIQLNY